jgi:hypothetical protein
VEATDLRLSTLLDGSEVRLSAGADVEGGVVPLPDDLLSAVLFDLRGMIVGDEMLSKKDKKPTARPLELEAT